MAFSKKQQAMLSALHRTLGVVTSAAEAANVHRSQHYEWLKTNPEYKAEVEAIEDEAIDYAESQLFQNIQSGDNQAILFYLKCKGKKRGYVEKSEVQIEGDTTFKVKFGGDE